MSRRRYPVRALVTDGLLTLDEADTLATMRGKHIDEVWTGPRDRPAHHRTARGLHAVVLLETGHTHEEVSQLLGMGIGWVVRCDQDRLARLRRRAHNDARRKGTAA